VFGLIEAPVRFDFMTPGNTRVEPDRELIPFALVRATLDRHVFVSTTYSKAVLRVAAELVCEQNPLCDYFPSYEIITSPYARGANTDDCREVTEAGVKNVMSVFFRHYGGIGSETPVPLKPAAEDPTQTVSEDHGERDGGPVRRGTDKTTSDSIIDHEVPSKNCEEET
jgi:hypothetical protein